MSEPSFRIAGTVLSTRDVRALASFYEQLLGWPRLADEPGWVVLRPSPTGHGLSFHEDVEYVPPTWPSNADRQQMMIHLDIATDDLAAAVDRVITLGGALADQQPQDGVRVMLDPDGHPFCLFEAPPA